MLERVKNTARRTNTNIVKVPNVNKRQSQEQTTKLTSKQNLELCHKGDFSFFA
jgi:hypothetical protein